MLLASSLCCDEVNRTLEAELGKEFGHNFSMGGLAGFPFGGVTSFGAMAHHIPDDNSCFVIFAPHVGIDADGTVGLVNRRGRNMSGACCGSATAAAAYVSNNKNPPPPPTDPIDAQQTYVTSLLFPHKARLAKAHKNMPTELPLALYDAQQQMIDSIIAKASQEVAGSGKIVLLGGIQINTPQDMDDYFLIRSFSILDNQKNTLLTVI
eukprot:CAMPEP_0184869638 /NCGR_PEP_ID=MMETSP0580-20130426/34825_1 /TAXON_ID=1118495 /ORGANISM="Dactyliosolen fragilissimus" /LENGTH=207 /DNA_ID=CAMNT_0027371251 /DNA_START=301 /DNA_END=924 /DNA_ORIENTATION=+